MKKAAVILPGLVRTYLKTYENFFSNIVSPNSDEWEIDIYLAFWDHTHFRGPASNPRMMVQKIENKEVDKILKMYSPKKYMILQEYEKKNNIEFKKIANDLVNIIGMPRHSDGISLIQNGIVAQTYSWYKAFSLIEEEYDVVIKYRFDIQTPPVIFNDIEKDKYNCIGQKGQYPSFKIADIVFASGQAIMEKCMKALHLEIVSLKTPNISKRQPNVFPEFVVKDFLQRNNIQIKQIRNLETIIIRE